MSVWKKLNTQDAFVTSYIAKKQWRASATEVDGLGVKFLPANKTYYEPDCILRIKTYSCGINIEALSCAINITAQLVSSSPTPTSTLTPTPTSTFTPTPTSTLTPTPSSTPTLDCDITQIVALPI